MNSSEPQGLWRRKSGQYISYPIDITTIPKNAKLLVETNPNYQKRTNRPKYLFSFIGGDANCEDMEESQIRHQLDVAYQVLGRHGLFPKIYRIDYINKEGKETYCIANLYFFMKQKKNTLYGINTLFNEIYFDNVTNVKEWRR